ncbi:hypothetical protein H0H93_005770 [Arthromyces matolae]|nr:hypothetical protein H0H93_005770 [Arthromyces matolae]
MLYYRLLHELTSLAPPFDFAAFWEKVAVDPTKTFSKKFLTEARLSGENASCLNDLSNAWVNAVHDLDITELQLVYRLLGNNRGKRKGSWRDHKKRCANPSIAEEERALACAIEASLRDAGASGTILIEGPPSGISNVLCAGPSTSGVLETPSSTGTSSTNVMDNGRNTDAETPPEVGTPLTSTIKNALQDLNDLNGHAEVARKLVNTIYDPSLQRNFSMMEKCWIGMWRMLSDGGMGNVPQKVYHWKIPGGVGPVSMKPVANGVKKEHLNFRKETLDVDESVE